MTTPWLTERHGYDPTLNSLPDIIISEDARLVAVRQNNSLYVNRARPAAFTIDNWRKAYRIHEVKTPDNSSATGSEGFVCEDGLCSFDLQNGQVLVYAENRSAADIACTIGDIIVLAYAGNLSCPDRKASIITGAVTRNGPVIITRQQLALHGVAEIYLEPDSRRYTDTAQIPFPLKQQSAPMKAQVHQAGSAYQPEQAQVVFAVGEPQRPWHSYRLWSRAARNLEDPK